MKNVTEMTTKDLVAEYNSLTGKAITKFSSRAAGEAQVLKAREAHKPAKEEKPAIPQDGSCCPKCGAIEDQTAAGLEGTAAADRLFCHHCSTEYYQNGKIYKQPAKSSTRRESIIESWNNKEVAEKRSQRYQVHVVGGNKENKTFVDATFSSTLKAFVALGLSVGGHIAFRKALVEAGTLKHSSGYEFTIVK